MSLRNIIKLKKELGLPDIIAISTGSMISSGFFLLPGIAAQQAGPSVFLAYLFAALLIMPAMFSIAELSSATPKAGGGYFFIDRALGPLFGTIGGIGNYLAVILKTAFALVGIGAYAALFFEIPIKLTAIIFGLVFMIMNILGVRKASGIQKFFVLMLLVILVFFLAEGVREIFFSGARAEYMHNFSPFLPEGFEGLMTTTALVFVSYLGLTQIASMAEEIKNPEYNIPLGLILSLVITTMIYVTGVFIMVAVIPPAELWQDLAPASTAASKVFTLLSPRTGTLLIIIAAASAFASTGNAGLMTASRFPLAMARDRLLPEYFSRLSKFNTPVISVLVTSAVLFFIIIFISEGNIARLASSFLLLIFMLINASVIVMRKSRIAAYDPGYSSPFFPWMQVFGIISSFFLIIYLGWGPGLFTMGVIALSAAWYWHYARSRTKREGAIFHWYALLGQREHKPLETELLNILKEKGLREGDPFGEMIVKASITDLDFENITFSALVTAVSEKFARELRGVKQEMLIRDFLDVTGIDPAMIIPRVSILYSTADNIHEPLLHIVLSKNGVKKAVAKSGITSEDNIKVFFFMLNRPDEPKQQLRLLSRLMDIVERENFVDNITRIKNPREIKEYLLHNDRYITLHLLKGTVQEEFINRYLKEIRLPVDVLVAMIQRDNQIFTPRGDTVLRENDIITVIGEPGGIKTMFNTYIHSGSAGNSP
jgi:basic amino acid/polyamine antiporter, APA family